MSAPRPRTTSSTRRTSTVPELVEAPTLSLIGGPTALIEYGGLRLLTDPTFDPPGDHPRPGTPLVLHKLTGPAIPASDLEPIDATLISHDHHSDNLDPAGRAFLPRAGRVLTTAAGAQRLEVEATGMEPGESIALERPDGGQVEITAVRADHGPPEVAPKNGPVIGFVLRGEELPSIYVSGDNASVEVVREIVARHGPIDSAVLFCGGAAVPEIWGEGAYLTLTPDTAVEAARLLADAPIVPVHQEGWAHFSFGPEELRRAFEDAGLGDRLRPVAPGDRVPLV
jgi:L-ascorbate metabolism protein UlaG (beta-lactamase superfamily)